MPKGNFKGKRGKPPYKGGEPSKARCIRLTDAEYAWVRANRAFIRQQALEVKEKLENGNNIRA